MRSMNCADAISFAGARRSRATATCSSSWQGRETLGHVEQLDRCGGYGLRDRRVGFFRADRDPVWGCHGRLISIALRGCAKLGRPDVAPAPFGYMDRPLF